MSHQTLLTAFMRSGQAAQPTQSADTPTIASSKRPIPEEGPWVVIKRRKTLAQLNKEFKRYPESSKNVSRKPARTPVRRRKSKPEQTSHLLQDMFTAMSQRAGKKSALEETENSPQNPTTTDTITPQELPLQPSLGGPTDLNLVQEPLTKHPSVKIKEEVLTDSEDELATLVNPLPTPPASPDLIEKRKRSFAAFARAMEKVEGSEYRKQREMERRTGTCATTIVPPHILAFGQYRGKSFDQVPLQYLRNHLIHERRYLAQQGGQAFADAIEAYIEEHPELVPIFKKPAPRNLHSTPQSLGQTSNSIDVSRNNIRLFRTCKYGIDHATDEDPREYRCCFEPFKGMKVSELPRKVIEYTIKDWRGGKLPCFRLGQALKAYIEDNGGPHQEKPLQQCPHQEHPHQEHPHPDSMPTDSPEPIIKQEEPEQYQSEDWELEAREAQMRQRIEAEYREHFAEELEARHEARRRILQIEAEQKEMWRDIYIGRVELEQKKAAYDALLSAVQGPEREDSHHSDAPRHADCSRATS